MMRLEGLGQYKKIHLIGTRTRDLAACGIVSQPRPSTRQCSNNQESTVIKYCKINISVPTSLQTSFTAQAHLAKGQFLSEV
jgi:hypothetical protein